MELYPSFVDGLPTISPDKNTAGRPRSISARNDNTNIQNFLIPDKISEEYAKKIKDATMWGAQT